MTEDDEVKLGWEEEERCLRTPHLLKCVHLDRDRIAGGRSCRLSEPKRNIKLYDQKERLVDG